MNIDTAVTPKDVFAEPDFYFRHDYFIQIRSEIVRTMLPSAAGKSILDLGCGDGRVSLQFAPEAASVTLVDFSESMLERARRRIPPGSTSRVDIVRSDILGFAPGRRFDVVLCLGVLAHLPSARDGFAKIAALVEPGGMAIVQVTDAGTLLGRLASSAQRLNTRAGRTRSHQLQPASVSDLEQWGREAGLTMQDVRRHGVIAPGAGRLPNAMLLRWERFVLAHPVIARAGADAVVCFSSNGGSCAR
jgi:SAM-dependent methyltransferase